MDTSFLAFCGVAALLVLSPGATWAVVTDGAVDGGTRGGLWTVAGIGSANFSLAMASAFGLSAVFHRFPGVLRGLSVCGALYMAWLGLRAVRRAIRSNSRAADVHPAGKSLSHVDPLAERNYPGRSAAARFGRGLLTNLTNVSVVLFYTVMVPQFITPRDSFLGHYLLLSNVHVAMSIAWMGAIALFVGRLADRMTRPGVRRTMDGLTGLALLAFAVKIARAI